MDPSPPDPDLVALAEKLARGAHAGQTRRDGVTPYIVHPADVARRVDTDAEKAVAWLHDVLEDTATTSIDLHEAGIPANVIVARNPLATRVKRADIADAPTVAQRQKHSVALAMLAAEEAPAPVDQALLDIQIRRS